MPSPSKQRKKTFDPEGKGYDSATAKTFGLGPNKSGHFPSRVPSTGLLLKGRKHPTLQKTLDAEKRFGNVVRKRKDGRYYSNKPKKGK